jgi:hypothetical protein
VLFVGNSLTSFADLPGRFARLAASRGTPVDVVAHAPGGSTSTSAVALADSAFMEKTLPSKDWDFVVVQEHSELPALRFAPAGHEVGSALRRLIERVRSSSPRAHIVLLATWGYKDGDHDNCAFDPGLCTYGSMQDSLLEFYAAAARENGALLAPVGWAWREVLHARPDVELYADSHHPSGAGSYLAACVLYGIVFRAPSLGGDPADLPPARAAYLQSAADAVVFDPKNDWRRDERPSNP